jgi:parallel beta-helix repeat protein
LNNGPNNNTLINNTVSSNTNGFFLYSSSNNNLTNNIVNSNINGTRLDTNSISNILNNNTIKGNTQYGLYIYSSSKNDIKDGSISDNTNSDYYLNSAGATNNFTKTNFTSLRKIKFNDATSWFNYRNDTGNVWLKTNVFAAVTITRKLTNWNQNLMQWNDSASSTVTAGYNLTGLKSNTWYVVYNDSKPTYVLKTDSGGVINFTVYLNSEHQIKVREEYLIIDSVEIKPIDSPPDTVIPQANSTVYMNVTVNITNSTSLDKCMIRVFGPLDSYLNPTFGLLLGTIKIVNVKTQCFGNWSMRYWRTPGGCTGCLPPWNVSVDLNLTNGLTNFTSKTFIYNELAWTDDSVPTINFTGLPGDYVNSTNAYPLNMQNEGNVYINISINGTDFNWETYPSPQIGVGNVSYNESDTGKFKNLTHVYSLSNAYLAPTETRSLYFKANIPIGFRAQRYNNTIDFNSSFKATEVCNICYKFFNGACQAQNTSLGANLYGCEGSNKKCDSGNCITGQAKQPDSNWYNVTQNDKTYRPSARKRYAMIYAPDYDRVLMFGGDTAAGTVYLNDTWIFNFTDSKWYNVTKSGSPPKRSLIGSSMAYDSVNHRAIFFGGYAGFNYEETWEFNFANEMWYKRNPSASPPARNWVNLVYMSAHDRIILYGGYNNTQAGDTWEYNYTENKWYNVTKGGSCTPPVRGLDWMTYDSDNNRIIKFGGTKGATTFFNDTWIFNYTDSCWYNVTKLPLPPSMDSHSMAYDSESNLTILHGGTLKPGSIITNQTWAFNYTDLKWYNITSELETIPPQVNDHAIVYMLESDRIIRFGGQSNNNVEMDQTWLLNYTNGG